MSEKEYASALLDGLVNAIPHILVAKGNLSAEDAVKASEQVTNIVNEVKELLGMVEEDTKSGRLF